MNRSQRRRWLKKPEFKRNFSHTEREYANNLIKSIQHSYRQMEASNGLNVREKR